VSNQKRLEQGWIYAPPLHAMARKGGKMSENARRGMRDLLATRDVKIGHFVGEFMTPGIGHIIKAAGCDYVTFDMEHSGVDFETVRAALRFAEVAGLATMVRPPSKQYQDIARTLDIGADAIMAQSVDTAEEAGEIVACMKYPPRGRRGATFGHYHDRFAAGPIGPKLSAANEATALFALIESPAGVANADDIAAVDGVDMVLVGLNDLLADWGIPGEYDHPRVREAYERTIAACRARGKHCGVGGLATRPDLVAEFVKMGARYVSTGTDLGFLIGASTARAKAVREIKL
jgi:4-hydroxy-2-oxoheptanedioate aldolase